MPDQRASDFKERRVGSDGVLMSLKLRSNCDNRSLGAELFRGSINRKFTFHVYLWKWELVIHA
jgi:hypothetical protein